MQIKKWDSLWINAHIARCETGYDLLEHAALAVTDGKISWIGSMKDLDEAPQHLATHVYDINGKCMTPGLIDCHTHLIYAGNRAHEFELRLHGKSYEEIARQGGGILSTVANTRHASAHDLFAESYSRAQALMASGVTTLEIKSGYGLNIDTEIKMLQVAKRIARELPINIKTTFLGAHIIPPEFTNHGDRYVDHLCDELMPRIADEQLADAVDVFCEKIAFNITQTERIFKTAQTLKLAIKCHSEQLSNSEAVHLATQYHALSVDHLEYISQQGIDALAKSDTVAVLLPGAFYFLRETTLPPIPKLREQGIAIAIASDCNPGTSPILSLPIVMNMACVLFKLTPEEALLAVTKHAAKALNLQLTCGSLTVGKNADFCIWQISHPRELCYYLGGNPLKYSVCKGKLIHM